MQRVGFRLKVRPERLDEYRRRHREVWPAMLAALSEEGWHNYSLFLNPDGLIFGYFECDDPARAFAGMAARDVNTRWQADMAPFFEFPDGPGSDPMMRLEEVFHLE